MTPAAGVPWNMATRVEARDFCRWMQVAGKPARAHWRSPDRVPEPAAVNAAYAPSVRVHSETVLRCFYEFHLDAGTGPIVNPFPLARPGRANSHHNPMEPFRGEGAGRYRPKTPRRIPRQIPDEKFDELFAGLGSHWSPRTLVDRFPLCRICIRNVNKFLKPHRTQLSQAALFPDTVVIPLDVVEYRGPGLFGISP